MKLTGEIIRDTQGETAIPLIGIACYGIIDERNKLLRVCWLLVVVVSVSCADCAE